jgi:type II secretory ATPase GspE/PulE/Tfp pilus assembly ATPase PilB-like protein
MVMRRPLADPDTPLTIEGGLFDRGDNFRSILAFFSDGRMVVSKSHVSNPQVISFLEEVKLHGYDNVYIEPVDIGVIASLYEGRTITTRVVGQRDSARMRREVLELVGALSKRRTSDIHIVVGESSCSVRARIDGSMTHIADWPSEYGHSFCAAAFAMADASDVNYQPYEYQGARCSNRKDLRLPEGVISLRMQFNPTTYGGRAMIVRILYDSDDRTKGDIGDLGFAPEQVEDFEFLRAKPFGINIVAGPTGHGKSTTLQRNILAILREYNNNIAVFTVEDPPEYPIPGAVQMPVVNAASSEERAEAFTRAIAAALRSNPDRIMIGEVRDSSSAKLAFEAAMTGHQVWTTLHSNDAITIPFRLRDLHVEEYKLIDPSLLTGLISQRLVRKLCTYCRRPVLNSSDINSGTMTRLEEAEVSVNSIRIHNPKGCDKCNLTGYSGRTVTAEIIMPDSDFMDLVRLDKKSEAYQYWLTELNGKAMVEYGLDLIQKGVISPMDAERVLGYLIRPKRG